jgi:hypothetical protein
VALEAVRRAYEFSKGKSFDLNFRRRKTNTGTKIKIWLMDC